MPLLSFAMHPELQYISGLLMKMAAVGHDLPTDSDGIIVAIDATNLLCGIYDELNIDRTHLRDHITALYNAVERSITAPQDSVDLIKGLYRLIYGRTCREEDRGPVSRRIQFIAITDRFISDYRRHPLAHKADYLWVRLRRATVLREDLSDVISEYKVTLDNWLADIDACPASEQRRRIGAWKDLSGIAVTVNDRRWSDISARFESEQSTSTTPAQYLDTLSLQAYNLLDTIA